MAHGDPLFIFRLSPVVLRLVGATERDARALLSRCGLPETAATGTITAPLSRVRQLLDEASMRWAARPEARDVPFAVALALAAPEGTYDTTELLVRTAPTLGHGLRALARYAALINPVGRFEVRCERGVLELHYFLPGSRDALGPQLNTFTIAYVAHAIGRVMHGELRPRAVWLAHRDAKAQSALVAHFGCPVELGAPTCGLAIDQALTEAPLRTSDPVVWQYLERQAEARLAAQGQRSFAAVLVDAIESQVGFGAADLKRVARSLGATERTVQRRLEDEGTSFRTVLDEARKRRAQAMLGSGESPARIAEVLGFADTRSFRRAFRRWLS
jgi:AraC-like DNA-binding protein